MPFKHGIIQKREVYHMPAKKRSAETLYDTKTLVRTFKEMQDMDPTLVRNIVFLAFSNIHVFID